MDGYTRVCRLDEIPMLGSRVLCRPEGRVAVFRTRHDHVFALADRCPHRGGPLHDWIVDLPTGTAVAPDQGAVASYAVCLVDGVVYVATAPAQVDVAAVA